MLHFFLLPPQEILVIFNHIQISMAKRLQQKILELHKEPPMLELPMQELPMLEPPMLEPLMLEPQMLETSMLEPPILEPPMLEPPIMDLLILDMADFHLNLILRLLYRVLRINKQLTLQPLTNQVLILKLYIQHLQQLYHLPRIIQNF